MPSTNQKPEDNEQKAYISKNSSSNIQVHGMVRKDNAGLPNQPKQQKERKRAVFFIDANNWYQNKSIRRIK